MIGFESCLTLEDLLRLVFRQNAIPCHWMGLFSHRMALRGDVAVFYSLFKVVSRGIAGKRERIIGMILAIFRVHDIENLPRLAGRIPRIFIPQQLPSLPFRPATVPGPRHFGLNGHEEHADSNRAVRRLLSLSLGDQRLQIFYFPQEVFDGRGIRLARIGERVPHEGSELIDSLHIPVAQFQRIHGQNLFPEGF